MRYVDACEHGTWHLMLSEVADDGEILEEKPYQYRCRSWRHAGPCRAEKGAQDFKRIEHALLQRDDWSFCTLTFKQSEWWDWKEQYQQSCPMWSAVRCRLNRKYGKCPYIQTWERHKKGGLHVHINIASEQLCADCYYDDTDQNSPFWANDFLRDAAVACGFGPRHWAEPLRMGTQERMSRYLVKVARELIDGGGKDQIPFDAPPHFRRLRASRGVLPPVDKGNWTGRMVFTPFPREQDA